jgi:hypothetical protein
MGGHTKIHTHRHHDDHISLFSSLNNKGKKAKNCKETVIRMHSFDFTAVAKKSPSFCDITPCNPLKVNQRYRGTIASIFRVEE